MNIYYDYISVDSSSYNAQNTANMYAILSKYTNQFAYTSGTATLVYDDTVSVSLGGSYDYTVYIDGRSLGFRGPNTYTVTSLVSETFYYFIAFSNSTSPAWSMCWIKSNGLYYFGAGTGAYIDNIGFACKTAPYDNRNYTIKKHAQFSLISPNILFLTASVISDGAGNYNTINDLRSCSTVPFASTVSINNVNYYAVGTNSLVRL